MADKATILEKICSNVFSTFRPVYFILKQGPGYILEYGGNLEQMKIRIPENGEPVSDILIFYGGNSSAGTGNNGVFLYKNVSLPQYRRPFFLKQKAGMV